VYVGVIEDVCARVRGIKSKEKTVTSQVASLANMKLSEVYGVPGSL